MQIHTHIHALHIYTQACTLSMHLGGFFPPICSSRSTPFPSLPYPVLHEASFQRQVLSFPVCCPRVHIGLGQGRPFRKLQSRRAGISFSFSLPAEFQGMAMSSPGEENCPLQVTKCPLSWSHQALCQDSGLPFSIPQTPTTTLVKNSSLNSSQVTQVESVICFLKGS